VKLKVIHLIRRIERIRRDIDELEQLQSGIRDDREYAPRLIDPLIDETLRLKKLENRIQNQIVKEPPQILTEVKSTAPAPRPEVELPEKRKKEATLETGHRTEPDTEKPTFPPETAPRKGGEHKKISYRFIFDKHETSR